MKESKKELHRLLKAAWFPLIFLLIIWAVRLFEHLFQTDLVFLGIYPLKFSGLKGILFTPLIHSDFNHLIKNSLPVFLLMWCIFYFYKPLGYRLFLLIYLISGIWIWFGGRPAYHVGASGLIYGFASFLFTSGILRGVKELVAISMLIIFGYGSLVWGILPYEILPVNKNMSWEAHLWGGMAGLVLAFYYRKTGPQKRPLEDIFISEDGYDELSEEWETTNSQTEEEEKKKPPADPLEEFVKKWPPEDNI